MSAEDAAGLLSPQPGPPAPPDATFADAIARAAEQAREEVVDYIRVPRYDPPMWIICRPLDDEEFQESVSVRSTAGHRFRVLHAADLLARTCQGIFLQVGDQRIAPNPDDPTGPLPTFGVGLQAFLGRDCGDEAVDWVLGLFRTEPDVISAGDELVTRSGYGNRQVKEQLAGK